MTASASVVEAVLATLRNGAPGLSEKTRAALAQSIALKVSVINRRDHPAEQDAREAVAWRVKDYADGWILFHHEAPARKSAEARNGALVQPLFAHPAPVQPDSGGVVESIIRDLRIARLHMKRRKATLADADALFDAAEYLAALAPVAAEGGESTGAKAVIRNGRIVISIDVDALPVIVSGSCATSGAIDGLWKVTDAEVFAKEVCHALNSEREDGTTRVHLMFDSAFNHAIDQGAEGIESVDDDEFEAESSRLQAALRTEPTGGGEGT